MHIVLAGNTPSKKNQKQIFLVRGRPMIMPSKAYKEWHDEKMWLLKGSPAIKGPVELKMTLYARDKRSGDLSNKFESVADLLVDAGIIEDDNWNIVRKVEMMFGGIDKEYPRVEIEIK